MIISKKEVPFIILISITAIIAQIVNLPELLTSSINPIIHFFYVLSGFAGIVYLGVGTLSLRVFLDSPNFLVLLGLAWGSIFIIMYFSKKLSLGKRLMYTYFFSTHFWVILATFFFEFLGHF